MGFIESPAFAISATLALAIVGVVMAMHPEWRVAGWLLIASLAALLLYSLAALILGAHPEATRTTALVGAAACGLLVGLAGLFALDNPWGSAPSAKRAFVRMFFFGDDQNPTEMASENVPIWYAYFNPSMQATYVSTEDGQQKTLAVIPKTWVIFLVFDKPTEYKEITVSLSAPGLPVYDVRQPTKRSVIVSFRSDIPADTLEISTKG